MKLREFSYKQFAIEPNIVVNLDPEGYDNKHVFQFLGWVWVCACECVYLHTCKTKECVEKCGVTLLKPPYAVREIWNPVRV